MSDRTRCPNCGGPTFTDHVTVGLGSETVTIPTLIECYNRCYEDDPEGYLEAVNREAP